MTDKLYYVYHHDGSQFHHGLTRNLMDTTMTFLRPYLGQIAQPLTVENYPYLQGYSDAKWYVYLDDLPVELKIRYGHLRPKSSEWTQLVADLFEYGYYHGPYYFSFELAVHNGDKDLEWIQIGVSRDHFSIFTGYQSHPVYIGIIPAPAIPNSGTYCIATHEGLIVTAQTTLSPIQTILNWSNQIAEQIEADKGLMIYHDLNGQSEQYLDSLSEFRQHVLQFLTSPIPKSIHYVVSNTACGQHIEFNLTLHPDGRYEAIYEGCYDEDVHNSHVLHWLEVDDWFIN